VAVDPLYGKGMIYGGMKSTLDARLCAFNQNRQPDWLLGL
jgi:hypothetical protein